MGALCRVGGGGACGELTPYITGGIQSNLERDSREIDQHSDLLEKLAHSPSSSPTSRENEERVGIMHIHMTPLLHMPSQPYCLYVCPQPRSPTAADVFHDTAGWRYLETYMTLVICTCTLFLYTCCLQWDSIMRIYLLPCLQG